MDGAGIRVVVFRDGDMWAGRRLEYDIGAQADSPEKRDGYLATAATRRESRERDGEALAGVPPAPERFRKLRERRAGDFTPQGTSPDRNVTPALCPQATWRVPSEAILLSEGGPEHEPVLDEWRMEE